MLPYESLFSYASINKKLKEKKSKWKIEIKYKRNEYKKNINIDFAIFAKSWHHLPLKFSYPEEIFSITYNMDQLCCPFCYCLLMSTLLTLSFLAWFFLSLHLSPKFVFFFHLSIISNSVLTFSNILHCTFYLSTRIISLL